MTLSPAGVVSVEGAKSIITYNKITGNNCNDPAWGPDYLTQFQGFGIILSSSAPGTKVSQNDLSKNDVGIGAIGGSGCCKIHDNILKDNRFFGIVIQDGKHTSSQDKISGGNVGVAAVSFGEKTVATLVNDKITGATTPTQELSCCGGTAEIVTVPPGGFKVSNSQFNVKSSQVENLMEQILRR